MNHYSILIEDFAIYASVLYELKETDFFEISQMDVGDTTSTKPIKENHDPTMEERVERGTKKEPGGRSLRLHSPC